MKKTFFRGHCCRKYNLSNLVLIQNSNIRLFHFRVDMEECPSLKLTFSMFFVPSMIILSKIMSKVVAEEIQNYSNVFRSTLLKHLLSEVEVSLVNGDLSSDKMVISQLGYEQEILQYRDNLRVILHRWSDTILGQPVQPEVHNIVYELILKTFEVFEDYILVIQNYAAKSRCIEDKKLVNKVCSMKSRVINLTMHKIPDDLIALLNNGPNFVPNQNLDNNAVQSIVENDIRKAAISTFYHLQGYYPHVAKCLKIESLISQLCSQVPSNSKQVSFFYSLYEGYNHICNQLKSSVLPAQLPEEARSIVKQIPKGSILTLADEGLGFVLLPVEWFVEQYKVQASKGGHIKTNLSSEQCLKLLDSKVQSFRQCLNQEELSALTATHKKTYVDAAIGILKLLPKVHKVKCLRPETWKEVPSRPIRGAENCPLNSYSKALCKLLQQLHDLVKKFMGSSFPIIKAWLLVRCLIYFYENKLLSNNI